MYINDGKGLFINHVGFSTLHTPSSFKLHNVLHVPKMQHNLLFAYWFINDNSCLLTLDINGSYVKDCTMGKTILRRPCKDGF